MNTSESIKYVLSTTQKSFASSYPASFTTLLGRGKFAAPQYHSHVRKLALATFTGINLRNSLFFINSKALETVDSWESMGTVNICDEMTKVTSVPELQIMMKGFDRAAVKDQKMFWALLYMRFVSALHDSLYARFKRRHISISVSEFASTSDVKFLSDLKFDFTRSMFDWQPFDFWSAMVPLKSEFEFLDNSLRKNVPLYVHGNFRLKWGHFFSFDKKIWCLMILLVLVQFTFSVMMHFVWEDMASSSEVENIRSEVECLTQGLSVMRINLPPFSWYKALKVMCYFKVIQLSAFKLDLEFVWSLWGVVALRDFGV